MGGMVLKLPIGTKGQNEIYVDTYKLPNGIYIYSLVTDGRLIDTKRMIDLCSGRTCGGGCGLQEGKLSGTKQVSG